MSNEEVDELSSIKYCSKTKTDEICTETNRLLAQISSSNLKGVTKKEAESPNSQKSPSGSTVIHTSSANLHIIRIPVNYASPQNHRYILYPSSMGESSSEESSSKAGYAPLSAPPTPPTQLAQTPPTYTATIWSHACEKASPAPSAPTFDELQNVPDPMPRKILAFGV